MRFSIALLCALLLVGCGSSGESSDAGTDIQSKALLGQACHEDPDCEQGWCQDGYCTNSCSEDGDCESQAEDNRSMCCVSSLDHESFCEKITAGGLCGDRSGTCGASCTDGLNSMCATGFYCFAATASDPQAICTMTCEETSDCEQCSIECVTCTTGPLGVSLCIRCLT